MNADEQAHQHIQQARGFAEHTAQLADKQRKERAAVDAARLRRLQDNEDYQWFMATYFAPIHQHNHEQALNLSLSPKKRNNFAHRHDLSKTLKDLPAAKEAELRTIAGLDLPKV